jgi:hypothetical protein
MEIILPKKSDADKVMEAMTRYKEQNGGATVEQLYNLVSLSPTYKDHFQGWTKGLSEVLIEETDGQCTMTFPEPVPLQYIN